MLTPDDIRMVYMVTGINEASEPYVVGYYTDFAMATQDAQGKGAKGDGTVEPIECARLGETYVRLGPRFAATALQTTTAAQAKTARQEALSRAAAVLSPEDLAALGIATP